MLHDKIFKSGQFSNCLYLCKCYIKFHSRVASVLKLFVMQWSRAAGSQIVHANVTSINHERTVLKLFVMQWSRVAGSQVVHANVTSIIHERMVLKLFM
jgi:hypothetical protein